MTFKFNFLISIFFLYINFCSSQSDFCNDTVFYNDVFSRSQKETVSILITEYITDKYKSNTCRLKFYAYLIDELFSTSLDLEMKFRLLYRNSYLGPDSLNIAPVDSSILKYEIQKNLFLYFVEINKSYEQFCNIYYIEKQKECELICDNIIEYGIFKNPDKVKKFMNHKYKNINRDYYEDHLRKLMKRR